MLDILKFRVGRVRIRIISFLGKKILAKPSPAVCPRAKAFLAPGDWKSPLRAEGSRVGACACFRSPYALGLAAVLPAAKQPRMTRPGLPDQ